MIKDRNINVRIDELNGKHVKSLNGHKTWVNCLEIVKSLKVIISGSQDQSIKIWSTDSGDCLQTLTGHKEEVECLAVSEENKFFVSGSDDETIKIWDLSDLSDCKCIETLKEEASVLSLYILPNDQLICGLSSGKINKWSLKKYEKIATFQAHEEPIFSLKHIASNHVASGSWDTLVKVINFLLLN